MELCYFSDGEDLSLDVIEHLCGYEDLTEPVIDNRTLGFRGYSIDVLNKSISDDTDSPVNGCIKEEISRIVSIMNISGLKKLFIQVKEW